MDLSCSQCIFNGTWKPGRPPESQAGYHRFVQSGKTFYRSQYQTNGYLMKWARRNHGNKSPKWLRNHYWGQSKGKRYFSCMIKKGNKSQVLILKYQPDVRLARYIKIKGGANPYLKKDKDYFAMRDKCANFKLLESRRILPLVYAS